LSKYRNHLLFVVAGCVSLLLMVKYIMLVEPAQARAVKAACNGMRPSPTNPNFGSMDRVVAAANFSLQDEEGRTVSLADYKGKIVVMNFWASWCSVCRSEKPSLETLQDEYGEDQVVVLAVASDRDWAPVKRAMLGFEVVTADEVLRKPEIYGIRDPKLLSARGQQVVVSRIDRGRAAAGSGLGRLDRIVSLNGMAIETLEELDRALRASGTKMEIGVLRDGANKTITLAQKRQFKVLLDPPDDDGNLGAIAKAYGITAVPESFVVDRSGNIQHYFINKRNWDGDVAATCLQDLVDG
jgi:thiol-disulfide isomerase/thioredoxin